MIVVLMRFVLVFVFEVLGRDLHEGEGIVKVLCLGAI